MLDRTVTVVGGGLTGALASIFLARRGYTVHVYEGRQDPRIGVPVESKLHSSLNNSAISKAADAAKRSINLALSTRGIRALQHAGLEQTALQTAVPMYGRMIHDKNGGMTLQRYGSQPNEMLYSVSRVGINIMLLNELEKIPNVHLHFRHKCTNVRADGSATFVNQATSETVEVGPGRLLGCDGAYSAVRSFMGRISRLSVSLEYIDSGYKELSMPPASDGTHAMPPNALHIWSSGELMLIALPNDDGSFTCTLFGSFPVLESANSPELIKQFFLQHFPDAVPLMPDLVQDYMTNPIGALSTVRCSPWNLNAILLLGDAAHGVVPFYGQGMNCGFEDCIELDSALDAASDDWITTLESFANERKKATDALADLALANYIEMRDKTIDRLFLLKCKVHAFIHSLLGSACWQPSLHTAVSFTTMPYHKARSTCAFQDRMLFRAAATFGSILGFAALFSTQRYLRK